MTLAAGLLLAGAIGRPALAAVSLPPDFVVENPVVFSNFSWPVGIAFLPDGRWLVAEKAGRVIVVQNRIPLVTPFIDLSAEVLNDGDRGLTGIAIDPQFATNGYVYLMYTVDPDSDGVDNDAVAFGRLVRYQASALDPNLADPASRTVLMGTDWSDAPPSGVTAHTVDHLGWGSDGTLLVSIGDGAGSADSGGQYPDLFQPGRVDPAQDIGSFRSPSLASLDGKVLRLDPATGWGVPSNPYFDAAHPSSPQSRIWAKGFRNPYRFTVRPGTGSPDPADGNPGTLYVGDVGWATWEEVDVVSARGVDYGWPCFEGDSLCAFFQGLKPASYGCGSAENSGPYANAALVYHHADSTLGRPAGFHGNCVIGGSFYGGSSYPAAYRGGYFFLDFVRGVIRHATVDAGDQVVAVEDFATGLDGPVHLTVDPVTGDLIYIDIMTNMIRRIRYAPPSDNHKPVAVGSATPGSGAAPLMVQFSSEGSFDPDGDAFKVFWSFGDNQGGSDPDPLHTYVTPGQYRAVLSLVDARGAVGRDTLRIDVQPPAPNTPPSARIDAPADSSFFVAGNLVELRGTANDTEDPAGSLAASWEVDLHHNIHIHHSYVLAGDTSSFVPENHEDGTGFWYEIRFIVTDSGGLRDTAFARIDPEVDLAPSPASADPPVPITGALVRLSFQIENRGRMLARRSHWILRAGSTTLAEGDTAIAALGRVSMTVALPLRLPAGTTDFTVTADAFNLLRETSETNNVSHSPIVIAAPPPFPSAPVVDTFNRPDGKLTAPWVGDLTSMALEFGRLKTTTTSYRAPLWGAVYGPDQEAYVSFNAFAPASTRQGLVLKAQGTDYRAGQLEVRFDYPAKKAYVYAYTTATGWASYGSIAGVRMVKDDALGARAFADGDVDIFRNGQKLGTVSVASWPFAGAGGRVGVVLEKATAGRLDNFGGGPVGPAARPPENVPLGRSTETPPPAPAWDLPATLALSPPRPNPTHGSVAFALDLPGGAPVRFAVSDVQGRVVWSEIRTLGAGRWQLSWPGSDRAGRPARPGLYFARVLAGERAFTRRIALVP